MLNAQEKKIVEAGMAQGMSKEDIMKGIDNYRSSVRLNGPSAPVDTTKDFSSPLSKVAKETMSDFEDIGKDALNQFSQAGTNIVNKVTDPNKTVPEKIVGATSEAFRRGGRFIGSTYLNLAKMLLPQSWEDKIKEIGVGEVEKVKEYNKKYLEENKDTPGVQKFNEVVEKYKTDPNFKEAVDNAGGFVEGLGEILGTNKISPKTDVIDAVKNVRKLEPEFDVPYFQEAESTVSDAISKLKSYVPDRNKPKDVNVPSEEIDPSLEVKDKFRTELINNISVNVTNKTDQEAITTRLDKLIEQGEFQKAADEAKKASETAGGQTPLSQKVIDSAVNLGQKTAQKYRDITEGVTDRISQNLDRQALSENATLEVPKVEANIGEMYINAVSPGVKGKKQTVEGFNASTQQAVNAIKSITKNKKDLKFRDIETNEFIEGQLPTNLWEFGGAITHRKASVYQKVLESIGEAADKPVNTERIINAMEDIVNDPVYAGFPQIQKRAKNTLSQYMMQDYTPGQIERLIQLENDRLQAFYRGNGTQADAIVSAIVVNNLRDLLDEAVEQAGGEAVRDLKKEYGALKSIERDVVHRGIHNAQARKAGMVDMASIRNIGDFAQGMSGDLSALKRTGAEIAGQSFITALNDRDALIKRMFLVSDQAYSKMPNE